MITAFTRLLAASLLTAFALSAQAGDWYSDVGAVMGKLKQSSRTDIWLYRQTGTVSVTGQSGSCQINTVVLSPPSGKEKEWLSMALAAVLTGKSLSVYGECDAANSRIVASRIVIVY